MASEAAFRFDSPPDPSPQDAALITLVETIEDLSSARTVDQIAAVVRSSARRISGADGIAFVLRDDDKCWYLDEDAIGPLWKGRRFPLTACISGWAMLNGKTAIIPDIYKDDRIPHDAYRPTFVKSLVMTPVRIRDPIAAIGAYWAEQRMPTDEEVLKLQVMARATATALETVRAHASLNESLERRKFLLRELDHRCKNTLAAVQSIADQTLRQAASPQAFVEAFDGRLAALAKAHELLTKESWGVTKLTDIIRVSLEPFGPVGDDRVRMAGPELDVRPETAVALHMTFHELAMNAVRHGSLSTPRGRVSILWDVNLEEEQRRLRLTWKEEGGPVVTKPDRKGFGARLLERGMARDLDGQARLGFEPDGVRFTLSAPLSSRIALA